MGYPASDPHAVYHLYGAGGRRCVADFRNTFQGAPSGRPQRAQLPHGAYSTGRWRRNSCGLYCRGPYAARPDDLSFRGGSYFYRQFLRGLHPRFGEISATVNCDIFVVFIDHLCRYRRLETHSVHSRFHKTDQRSCRLHRQ